MLHQLAGLFGLASVFELHGLHAQLNHALASTGNLGHLRLVGLALRHGLKGLLQLRNARRGGGNHLFELCPHRRIGTDHQGLGAGGIGFGQPRPQHSGLYPCGH